MLPVNFLLPVHIEIIASRENTNIQEFHSCITLLSSSWTELCCCSCWGPVQAPARYVPPVAKKKKVAGIQKSYQ